ncbi:MAG: hypothetical protein P1Q69_14285 [Candidatus Thorarchaeota archaeon]|nr:hypothetical protein [Candidatus Thorarchaeota archaeon]
MNSEYNEEQMRDLLKGKTMRVYAYLLTKDTVRLRDIQYTLNFSSPSLVLHHLNKLIDADLVVKDAFGDYAVKKDVRVGSLTLFVKLGSHFLPRFLFQATLLVCILIPYMVFFMSMPPDAKDVLFLFVVITTVCLLIYEGYKMWFLKPM